MNCRNLLGLLLLPALLLLPGCAANLPECNEQGYGIVIFPDKDSSAVWNFQGDDGSFTPKFANVGGGYRAVVLEPGVYELSGFYNTEKRSLLGRGHKDLDYADRGRGDNIPPSELENTLGLVLVKRLPIKEERGENRFGVTHVVEVSSEYRMSLSLPQGEGAARFSVKAGEVLLLPSLSGKMSLNEKNCTRKGFIMTFYTPDILAFNPEDFYTLEWYCPLDKLAITLAQARLDELKAVADPEVLPPELLAKAQARNLSLGPWLQRAARLEAGEPGQTQYIFTGP